MVPKRKTTSKKVSRSSRKETVENVLSNVSTTSGMEMHRIAHYTFFVGLLIAIIAGFFRSLVPPEALVTTLVILGFVVGLFNLTAQETIPFLVAAIALMLAGIVNLGLIPGVGLYLRSILSNIVVFVVPGAIIVAMKTIWKLASD